MLRLEREARWGPVNISVRHRENMFTSTFFFAMSIAIGIHAIGLLLFNIKPYFIRDPARFFPPVEVVIDFSSGKNKIEAQVTNERKKAYLVLDLPISKPSYPDLLPLVIENRINNEQEVKLNKDHFAKMTETMVADESLQLDGSGLNQKPQQPITVHVSGNLSRYSLVSEGWLKKKFGGVGLSKKAKSYHTSFDVKLDNRTGRIFWYHQLTPLKKAILNTYAEEILHLMEFKKDPQGFITKGVVEILVYYHD